jgi:hypothetical protein
MFLLSTLKPLISRLFPNLLPSVRVSDIDQFATSGEAEGNRFALETVGGSTTRSGSWANTESPSDADMIYNEDNFRVREVEQKVGIPVLREVVDDGNV